eukprot:11158786-Lingulodinium_polyedra.AAC.1
MARAWCGQFAPPRVRVATACASDCRVAQILIRSARRRGQFRNASPRKRVITHIAHRAFARKWRAR